MSRQVPYKIEDSRPEPQGGVQEHAFLRKVLKLSLGEAHFPAIWKRDLAMVCT